MGIQAITVGTGKIIVSIDPTSDYWEEQLPYVLAHEYHHSVWTSRNFTTTDFTPLEYLILEGKADSFAKNLGANIIITIQNPTSSADLHTIMEAVFKSFGLALDQATQIDPRRQGMVPSTKGIID